MITYQEYKDAQQKEVNELPIHYAFSNEQLNEILTKLNYKPEDLVSIGYGGLVHKNDLPTYKAWLTKPSELPELMKKKTFARQAIRYELDNHEYFINWQGAYDVCGCFMKVKYGENKTVADYCKEAGMEFLIPIFADEINKHIRRMQRAGHC